MENKRYVEEDDVIDVLELVRVLMRHWFLLGVCFVSGALLLGGLAYIRPYTYTSTASIFIQSDSTSITKLADIQLGNALSKDFTELATCKPVLDTAIEYVYEETGEMLERWEIKNATRISNKEGTRLLTFHATTGDALLSKAIAQAMSQATAEQVSAIMNAEEPTFVDLAEIGEVNSKGLLKNILMGGIIGMFIPAAIFIFQYLFNVKITTEEDVKKYLNVNVVGVISLDRGSSYKGKK